ncbi:hypothetical protein TorRG33x02_322550 [Trema orientale]|uniref:Uncharacterized protein n=1 Tax=Trema orientale TaxID=63057 RepID=A0A2P5BFY6_TREOI|nr:hypothetical protein TorRG33x02_322550 [Trema orientale]
MVEASLKATHAMIDSMYSIRVIDLDLTGNARGTDEITDNKSEKYEVTNNESEKARLLITRVKR